MNITQVTLPDGTTAIEIEDDTIVEESTAEENTFEYERSEIESYLIEECERLAEETGKTHFLFDTKLTGFIKKKRAYDEAARRDIKLDSLLETGAYHIGTEEEFEEMPSRFSYYDTETKSKCRYEKSRIAIEFLKTIGFEASPFNYGAEMEQAFIFESTEKTSKGSKIEIILDKFIVRIQPNLFIRVLSQKDGLETVYVGFFSKKKIFYAIERNLKNSTTKILMRDAKLKAILK
jgi:hypothetical protein